MAGTQIRSVAVIGGGPVVDYFYDGRLFALLQVGEHPRKNLSGRLMSWHMQAHLSRSFTGKGTTNRYSVAPLDFMIRYGLAGNEPRALEVR